MCINLLSEATLQVAGSGARRKVFSTWQALPARHVFVCWIAEEIPDEIKLMAVALTREDRLANEHFSKYATAVVSTEQSLVDIEILPNTPNVNGCCVLA